MRRAAARRRRVAQLARVALGQRYQLGKAVGLQRRGRREENRGDRRQCHARQVLHRVIGHLRLHAGIDDMRGDHHAERVPVRRRLGHVIGADDGIGAGLVFDHDRLIPYRVQLRGQKACQRVDRPARRIRHHQPDRLRRMDLRVHGKLERKAKKQAHRSKPGGTAHEGFHSIFLMDWTRLIEDTIPRGR